MLRDGETSKRGVPDAALAVLLLACSRFRRNKTPTSGTLHHDSYDGVECSVLVAAIQQRRRGFTSEPPSIALVYGVRHRSRGCGVEGHGAPERFDLIRKFLERCKGLSEERGDGDGGQSRPRMAGSTRSHLSQRGYRQMLPYANLNGFMHR
jgi:hypothetical protein